MPGARPGSTSEARFRSLLDDCAHASQRTQDNVSDASLLSSGLLLLSNDSFASLRSPRLPGSWLCVCWLQISSRTWMCWVSTSPLSCSPAHWAVTLDEWGSRRTFKSIGHVSTFITVDHGDLELEAPGFMGSVNRKGFGGWAESGSNDLTHWEESIVS